jgi:hypothetical protein
VRPRRFSARRGTTIRYRLSEAANVTFRIERVRHGRRKAGRCRLRLRRGPRCTRSVRLQGALTDAGPRGASSFRFRGRLDGRRLARGSYRLVAVAQDAAGNRGRAVRAGMRVVR